MTRPDLVAAYLSEFVPLYPTILDWYVKVASEVGSGRRSIFAVVEHDQIRGLAITKNAYKAKLCHLSLSPKVRHHGLGMLLTRVAIETMLSKRARSVHVTTSEEVASSYGAFFKRVGFSVAEVEANRYRNGCSELVWKANAAALTERLYQPEPITRLAAGVVQGSPRIESTVGEPLSNLKRWGIQQLFVQQRMPHVIQWRTSAREECDELETLSLRCETSKDRAVLRSPIPRQYRSPGEGISVLRPDFAFAAK